MLATLFTQFVRGHRRATALVLSSRPLRTYVTTYGYCVRSTYQKRGDDDDVDGGGGGDGDDVLDGVGLQDHFRRERRRIKRFFFDADPSGHQVAQVVLIVGRHGARIESGPVGKFPTYIYSRHCFVVL